MAFYLVFGVFVVAFTSLAGFTTGWAVGGDMRGRGEGPRRMERLCPPAVAPVVRHMGTVERHLPGWGARLDRIEKNSHAPNDDATPES